MVLLLASLWLGIALAESGHAGASAAWPAQVEQRRQREYDSVNSSIRALLDAQAIIAGNDPAGKTASLESRVSTDLKHARMLYLQQDYAAGRQILDRAYADVRQAIVRQREGKTLINRRDAGDQYAIRPTQPKPQQAYQRLAESIDVLLDAYRRVAVEKGHQAQAEVMQRNIDTIRMRADGQQASGAHAAALELLDGAYTLTREALASLRHGDVLVQTLNFSTREEEYRYYQQKTQSQRTALQVLLDVSDDASKNTLVQGLMASSQVLLDEAGVLAAKQDFAAAVPIMERALNRLQSGLMMSLSTR